MDKVGHWPDAFAMWSQWAEIDMNGKSHMSFQRIVWIQSFLGTLSVPVSDQKLSRKHHSMFCGSYPNFCKLCACQMQLLFPLELNNACQFQNCFTVAKALSFEGSDSVFIEPLKMWHKPCILLFASFQCLILQNQHAIGLFNKFSLCCWHFEFFPHSVWVIFHHFCLTAKPCNFTQMEKSKTHTMTFDVAVSLLLECS